MKFLVHHWMGRVPPHPEAEKSDEAIWYLELNTIEDVVALASEYEVMFAKPSPPHQTKREQREQPTPDDAPVRIWLDDRSKKFRAR